MRAVYSIIQRNGAWCIRVNGNLIGPAGSLLEAGVLALRSAERLHAQGWHTHIMLQAGAGYRTLWVNGSFKQQLAA